MKEWKRPTVWKLDAVETKAGTQGTVDDHVFLHFDPPGPDSVIGTSGPKRKKPGS